MTIDIEYVKKELNGIVNGDFIVSSSFKDTIEHGNRTEFPSALKNIRIADDNNYFVIDYQQYFDVNPDPLAPFDGSWFVEIKYRNDPRLAKYDGYNGMERIWWSTYTQEDIPLLMALADVFSHLMVTDYVLAATGKTYPWFPLRS